MLHLEAFQKRALKSGLIMEKMFNSTSNVKNKVIVKVSQVKSFDVGYEVYGDANGSLCKVETTTVFITPPANLNDWCGATLIPRSFQLGKTTHNFTSGGGGFPSCSQPFLLYLLIPCS